MKKNQEKNDEPNLDLMKKAIRNHYEKLGYQVRFPKINIPVGNAAIDGEIIVDPEFKIAVELKGPNDNDVVKGLGQLSEALIKPEYRQAILVVTKKRGRTVRRESFKKIGIGLVTVDSDANLCFLLDARDSYL